jgi:hypothetical protein
MLDIIAQEEIDDLIFALGMYGAMSNGTIHMMRKLGEGGVGMRPRPTHGDSLPADTQGQPMPQSDSSRPAAVLPVEPLENDSNG